ncbi:hypothetical protein CGLO_18400 [Colletotrichum gloeosporioides Cg-14]
MSYKF